MLGYKHKIYPFQKNVSNYSDAYKSIIRTPQNIISDNISYLDYEEIFKIIKTKNN